MTAEQTEENFDIDGNLSFRITGVSNEYLNCKKAEMK